MPRMIDADALATEITVLIERNSKFIDKGLANLITDAVEETPTVEAEPVRYGHWVENNGRYGWYCSQCKKENNYAYDYNENNVIELQDHYCPNCGAKMDEVEDDV